MIGGPGKIICIDETATCNGLIGASNECNNDKKKTQWIISGVEEGNSTRLFLHLIRDRTIDTIYESLVQHIETGTIIRTDGYPSYAEAVRKLGLNIKL